MSCGSGIFSSRRPLTTPARQSMSSSCKAATSPARSPSRGSSIRTAKSRRPAAVWPSELASSTATCSGGTQRGRELALHQAAGGTACASADAVCPSRRRNRRNDDVAGGPALGRGKEKRQQGDRTKLPGGRTRGRQLPEDGSRLPGIGEDGDDEPEGGG